MHRVESGMMGMMLLALAGCASVASPSRLTAIAAMPADGAAALQLDGERLAAAVPVPRKLLEGEGTTRLKVGAFQPDGDIEDMDSGFYAEAVFSQEIIELLAIEASIGYFDSSGQILGAPADLSGVPMFVNGRLQLPVLVFEAYGGLGIGGVYVDSEVGNVSDTDFLSAWNAFLGLEVGLGGWGIGAEVKYLETEDDSNGIAIEGLTTVIFASLGF